MAHLTNHILNICQSVNIKLQPTQEFLTHVDLILLNILERLIEDLIFDIRGLRKTTKKELCDEIDSMAMKNLKAFRTATQYYKTPAEQDSRTKRARLLIPVGKVERLIANRIQIATDPERCEILVYCAAVLEASVLMLVKMAKSYLSDSLVLSKKCIYTTIYCDEDDIFSDFEPSTCGDDRS